MAVKELKYPVYFTLNCKTKFRRWRTAGLYVQNPVKCCGFLPVTRRGLFGVRHESPEKQYSNMSRVDSRQAR